MYGIFTVEDDARSLMNFSLFTGLVALAIPLILGGHAMPHGIAPVWVGVSMADMDHSRDQCGFLRCTVAECDEPETKTSIPVIIAMGAMEKGGKRASKIDLCGKLGCAQDRPGTHFLRCHVMKLSPRTQQRLARASAAANRDPTPHRGLMRSHQKASEEEKQRSSSADHCS